MKLKNGACDDGRNCCLVELAGKKGRLARRTFIGGALAGAAAIVGGTVTTNHPAMAQSSLTPDSALQLYWTATAVGPIFSKALDFGQKVRNFFRSTIKLLRRAF